MSGEGWPDLRQQAVEAVVAALTPRMLGTVAAKAAWPTQDPTVDARAALTARWEAGVDADLIAPWWDKSGEILTAVLTDVCDVTGAWASHLLGAALHARLTAEDLLGEDHVLRLAERAACWHAGRESRETVTE